MNLKEMLMLHKTLLAVSFGVVAAPAMAQDLSNCSFAMLPQADQTRFEEEAQAKTREFGVEGALPWIDSLSREALAKLAETGLCVDPYIQFDQQSGAGSG